MMGVSNDPKRMNVSLSINDDPVSRNNMRMRVMTKLTVIIKSIYSDFLRNLTIKK